LGEDRKTYVVTKLLSFFSLDLYEKNKSTHQLRGSLLDETRGRTDSRRMKKDEGCGKLTLWKSYLLSCLTKDAKFECRKVCGLRDQKKVEEPG